jgi:hypothetical protein
VAEVRFRIALTCSASSAICRCPTLIGPAGESPPPPVFLYETLHDTSPPVSSEPHAFRGGYYSPLPRLFFVGELDRLHIAPWVEDMSGVASLASAVLQDYAPVTYLPQFATHPCAARANSYNHIPPDPRLRCRLPACSLFRRVSLPSQ